MEPAPNANIQKAYERFGGRLLDYATRILHRRDHAHDIVQETFLRLCREDLEALEPRLAEWLFTVCRNCAFDSLRKEKRMVTTTQATAELLQKPGAAPAPALDFEQESSGLLKLLAGLPEAQREVIYLKFQHDLSYKDIAGVTGHSEGYVGFLIHAGMKQLREKFKNKDAVFAGAKLNETAKNETAKNAAEKNGAVNPGESLNGKAHTAPVAARRVPEKHQ